MKKTVLCIGHRTFPTLQPLPVAIGSIRGCSAAAFLRCGQVCAEVEEALEVVGERHERPFEAHFAESAQAEVPEPHRCFDDAEHGLDGLFALRVKFPPGLRGQPVRHDFFGARVRAGRGRVGAGFELRNGASVGLPSGGGVDRRRGRAGAALLGGGDGCFAVKSAAR